MKLWDSVEKKKTYIIAEMSANHAGELETAKEIIRQAKLAGADCLKIQTYTADTLTIDCKNDYFEIHSGLWEKQYLYDLYEKAATPWEWQLELKAECDKHGLDFLSTPFDSTSVDFLCQIGVGAFKIASFEIVDLPLIAYAASKMKPMILSCGMATKEEISDAMAACRKQGNDQIILLKCCSAYPADLRDMNLLTIADMIKEFQVPVGLSDHSLGNVAAIVGCSLGAAVIEKHFCLTREIATPDSDFSLTPEEFHALVQAVRDTESVKGSIKYGPTDHEKESMNFRRSIFAVKDIKKGERFTPENMKIIRPGHGLAPKCFESLLDRKSPRDIQRGEPIKKSDLEYES